MLIVETIDPPSWQKEGGYATISCDTNGKLEITQTGDNLRLAESLLAQLRATRERERLRRLLVNGSGT